MKIVFHKFEKNLRLRFDIMILDNPQSVMLNRNKKPLFMIQR